MAMTTNYGTKTRILLSGSAGKLYGREHIYELSTGDTREAVKAIDVNHPGLRSTSLTQNGWASNLPCSGIGRTSARRS